MDTFDLSILRILQQDATVPQREIAERVNLSAPSVQRRIKQLESDGVISGKRVILNPEKVGLPLTIVVNVELREETGGKIDKVKESFRDAPEVQQCYYVAGDVDFVLVIGVRDMAEYEALTRRLFFENSTIRKFRTMVAMDRTKVTTAINI